MATFYVTETHKYSDVRLAKQIEAETLDEAKVKADHAQYFHTTCLCIATRVDEAGFIDKETILARKDRRASPWRHPKNIGTKTIYCS